MAVHTEQCGWIVKMPYTTNQQYKHSYNLSQILDKIMSIREKYFDSLPYIFLQAVMANKMEYKVICFNGQPLYEAKIGICSRAGSSRQSFSSRESRMEYAAHVLNKFNTRCPEGLTSGLTRVDIFWCAYLGKMVVNELESLEARYDAGSQDVNKDFKLQTNCSEYFYDILRKYLIPSYEDF